MHAPSQSEACSADIYSLSAASAQKTGDVIRVVMADYPSTGSSWLKKLINVVARDAQHPCGEPACDIYNEAQCAHAEEGLTCPCSWNAKDDGSLFFKTHFPAQEIFRNMPLNDAQYKKTMHFDKILYLLRHPVATMNSNADRWGGSPASMARTLECWGLWWERARASVGESQVHMLHYEDLCLDTPEILHGVLQFLGGCYKNISKEDVSRTLSKDKKLSCIHQQNLYTQANGRDKARIETTMGDLMRTWGYDFDVVESWSRKDFNSLQFSTSHLGKNFSSTLNPWTSIW